MIPVKEDLHAFGGTKFADYFDPRMVRYLDQEFSEKDIDAFDAHIEDLLRNAGVRFSDLRDWNKKWIDNAMRDAKMAAAKKRRMR